MITYPRPPCDVSPHLSILVVDWMLSGCLLSPIDPQKYIQQCCFPFNFECHIPQKMAVMSSCSILLNFANLDAYSHSNCSFVECLISFHAVVGCTCCKAYTKIILIKLLNVLFLYFSAFLSFVFLFKFFLALSVHQMWF